MHAVAIVILIAWIGFWIYWLASSAGAKTGRTRWVRFAGVRIVLVLVALVLLRVKAFKGGQTITDNHWLQGIGLAVFLLGLAVAIWARRSIGRNWGMPMSEKVDAELVQNGPYRLIRHPIYSGILLAMVGTAIAVSWYWLIAVILLSAYFGYSAFMEERYLTSQLPEAYGAYKRGTKMFVPYVL